MRKFAIISSFLIFQLFFSISGYCLDEVTLQLRWVSQFQFAGYYAAIEKGYYTDAGLNVSIVEGGVGIDTIAQVLKGEAQFGVTNAELIFHRIKGEPVVALASIFQHSPHVFLSRNNSGINHPQDLVGKRVKMSRSLRDIELHAVLKNEGIDLDLLSIDERQATQEDYLNTDFDVVAAYITDQSYYLKKAGIPYTVISPSTYGVDFYGDTIFTSQNELDTNPERVKAFRAASLLGWRYAMENPEEIAKLLIGKYGSEKELKHLLHEAEEMRKLILPDTIKLGHMNLGRWEHIGNVLVNNGIVQPGFNLDGFVFDSNSDAKSWVYSIGGGLVLIIFSILGVAFALFILNNRLRKEILEHRNTMAELRMSQEQLVFNANQTEQFSLSAASMLSIKDENVLFKSISEAIVEYSDFSRVLISLFHDLPPHRELIGFAGVAEEIVAKVRNTELTKVWYEGVFKQGIKLGQASFYVPHTLKHILNQQAIIYGEGEVTSEPDKWHPEDNLFVRMTDEKGAFCGIISVDTSKSGLSPTDEVVRPLEIYASLISQIIIIKRAEKVKGQLEGQLRQAQKMEAIGNLAGGIAHDFNNILGVIIGNVEMALRVRPENEKYVSHLSEIKQASHRAKDIVQHLLEFSRKKERELQTVQISTTIEDSIKFLRSTLPSTITITEDIQLEGCHVKADPTQIYQIILNLCTNSAHAIETSDGLLCIKARVENIDGFEGKFSKKLPAGEYVVLHIIDNGHGIKHEYLHQIFDPYFTTKGVGKGTGMGLAIVHGIVESHNGAICVSSTLDVETIFTVYLPVSKGVEITKVCEKVGNVNGYGRIMLVDDNIELLNITVRQLEQNGYEVESYHDSLQALDMFSMDPANYDVIITDMTMPNLTGRELAEKIFQIRAEMIVFLCTGYSEAIDELQAREIGIKRYFEKPVSSRVLAKAIMDEIASARV